MLIGMTAEQLLYLAQAYADTQGLTLRRVGILAASNPMLFKRLAAGKGAQTTTVERAAHWLSHHWPRGVPWPQGIPEPSPYRPGATGGARSGGLECVDASGRDCAP